jgi:hypothetical protein
MRRFVLLGSIMLTCQPAAAQKNVVPPIPALPMSNEDSLAPDTVQAASADDVKKLSCPAIAKALQSTTSETSRTYADQLSAMNKGQQQHDEMIKGIMANGAMVAKLRDAPGGMAAAYAAGAAQGAKQKLQQSQMIQTGNEWKQAFMAHQVNANATMVLWNEWQRRCEKNKNKGAGTHVWPVSGQPGAPVAPITPGSTPPRPVPATPAPSAPPPTSGGHPACADLPDAAMKRCNKALD